MAYSIGPKYTPIDVQPIIDNYKAGVEHMDKQNAESFDRMMTGLKGIGTGVGKARQWMEAERIKKEMEERLKQLQDARAAANDELIGLNQMRDDAKSTVVGINNMLNGIDDSLGLNVGGYPYQNFLTDESQIMPYEAPKPNGSLNFGMEDYGGRFNPVLGRRSGL